ncbi:MAG TPA: DUF969 domain-containing protein [Micropepsaceae bacterium]|jgi:uncharacterized membrane protein|nr:DUF969 domain-containing protein [Micropepsaceae bacterium]
MSHALPLLGVAVVVLGFLARINPLLVVMAAAIVSGLAGGLDFVGVMSAFGKAFNDNRYVSVTWLVLPVIGALERAGLQERARDLIVKIRAASVFSILCLYMLIRQVAVAIGLTSLGGQATMVRPLIVPMAEAAGEARLGALSEHSHDDIRAQAAAAENIGLFFGEDIFIALGSILLIKGFLQQNGILVEPLQLSLWAIPTAILSFIVHAVRLFLFDRRLARQAKAQAKEARA